MTRGKPLGISARASNSDRCLDFPADALIFLYSDGLLEARGHVGLMFEMDGLSAQLADRSPNPGADNLSGLPAKFQVRTALSLHDDLIPPLVAPLISKSSGAPPGGCQWSGAAPIVGTAPSHFGPKVSALRSPYMVAGAAWESTTVVVSKSSP